MTSTLTDEQRHLLTALPSLIGGAMAMVGRSGLFGTGKELMASSQAMLAGAKNHPNNALIRDIVPNPAGDRSAEMTDMKATRDWSMARMKAKGVSSAETMRAVVLNDCEEAAQILAAHVDANEAAEYKAWAMQIAETVANAATEGGFLGFGGERLSDAEKTLLAEIRSALQA